MRRLAGVAFLSLAVAACNGNGGQPPELVVVAGDTEYPLAAWTYCFAPDGPGDGPGTCAEGSSPPLLPSITLNPGDDLAVRFPLPWTIDAQITPSGGICENGWIVAADPAGLPIEGLGPQGSYVVDVQGRGPQGTGTWTFELTTSDDYDLLASFAQLRWAPTDQDIDDDVTFGAWIANVAPPTGTVSTVVSVVASNGASEEYPLTDTNTGLYCWDGSLHLRAAPDFTSRVLELGPPPYEFIVTATVDESTMTTDSVRWPEGFLVDGDSPRGPITSGP